MELTGLNAYCKSDGLKTPLEIAECCAKPCVDRAVLCGEVCHKTYGPNGENQNYDYHKQCNYKCQELLQDCQSCYEPLQEYVNNMKDCANILGTNVKDDLIQCCRENCVSLPRCNEHCEQIYEYVYKKPRKISITSIDEHLDRDEYTKKRDRQWLYVSLALLAVIFVIAGYYLYKAW